MSLMTVHVIEARDLAVADDNGFSDPYCIITLGKLKRKTKVIKKTLHPKWNESFSLRKESDRFNISVYDWDRGSSDDFLGEIDVMITAEILKGDPKWFNLVPNPARGEGPEVRGDICLRFQLVVANEHAAPESQKLNAVKIKELKERVATAKLNRAHDLDLSGFGLNLLPQVIVEELGYISELDIGFNLFMEMPILQSFANLEILHLEGNQMKAVPDHLGFLSNLRELYLNGNHIATLTPEIGKLRKLEKLVLGNNQLTSIDWNIGYLTRLEELSLTGNAFETVPESIGCCFSIEILDLSCCGLKFIPEEFSGMTRLIELNLGTNELTKLPDGIGRMTRLVILNLSDNKLEDLPMTIGYCDGLGKIGSGINIDGNPIKSKDMLAKFNIGVDHLLDFLEKRCAMAGSPKLRKLELPVLAYSGPAALQQEVSEPVSSDMEGQIQALDLELKKNTTFS